MPNLKLTIRNCQRLLTFSQSGENWPNLVTLLQERKNETKIKDWRERNEERRSELDK